MTAQLGPQLRFITMAIFSYDGKNNNSGKGFCNCYDDGGNDDNFNYGYADDDGIPDVKCASNSAIRWFGLIMPLLIVHLADFLYH